MKIFISLIFVPFLFFFISCSASNIVHNYDYIKPNADINIKNIGFLKIYTCKYEEEGNYSEDPPSVFYKGYSIYSINGDFIRDVEKTDEPVLVRLEEGKYVIVAELHKNVVQSFLINIETGKLVEIDKSMVKNPIAMTR
jgi:hypothetical protein